MGVSAEFAPFVPFCFLGSYVAFLLAKPTIPEWLLVTGAGALMGAGFVRLLLGPWVCGIGLAAALWALVAPLLHRKTVHPAIAALVLYPWVATAAVMAMNKSGGLVLDRYILAADGSFGLAPGFSAAAFLLSHPGVRSVCEICYFGMPVALASLLRTNSTRRLMLLCGLLAVSAVAAYSAFPAVGSEVAFAGQFPWNPPVMNAALGLALFEPAGPNRNFMPSLHTAWGIALLLAAWPLGKWWRVGMLLYLGPMLFYTLGRHYLCDMIVAVPWTLAAWNLLERRWIRAAIYLAIAAAWVALIRFGLPLLYASPAVPWLLATATFATPVFFKFRSVSLFERTSHANRI